MPPSVNEISYPGHPLKTQEPSSINQGSVLLAVKVPRSSGDASVKVDNVGAGDAWSWSHPLNWQQL